MYTLPGRPNPEATDNVNDCGRYPGSGPGAFAPPYSPSQWGDSPVADPVGQDPEQRQSPDCFGGSAGFSPASRL